MKKVLGLVSALLLVGFAYANTMKVGVVDLPHILQTSPQVAAINKKLQEEFGQQQQQIIAEQNKIRAEAQKLNPSAADKLTPTERKAIQEKIATEQKQLQTMVVSFQEHVGNAQQKAMKNFMAQINAAVKTIASKENLSIVLLKPAVMYATDMVDITKQVTDALPKQ